MKALRDLELEVLPKWREKTMIIVRSSKLDIPLHEPLYCPQYPWVGVNIRQTKGLFSSTE
jgi:hypothetical protein